MSETPTSMGTAGLALRLTVLRGTASYAVYLVRPGQTAEAQSELEADLGAFDGALRVTAVPSSPGAVRLLHDLPSVDPGVLLVGAEAFTEADWRLLDRRRSALAREGATVFITTPESFDVLMRVAPNLASWLGGLVFSYEDIDAATPEDRGERLAALRAWSGRSDDEVLEAAQRGRLPRDPEYATWLVLLGRGDLLDA